MQNQPATPEPTLTTEAVRTFVKSHINANISKGRFHRDLITLIEIPALSEVMEEFSWNKSQAARYLGINRATLDSKLKRYNIKPLPAGINTSIGDK